MNKNEFVPDLTNITINYPKGFNLKSQYKGRSRSKMTDVLEAFQDKHLTPESFDQLKSTISDIYEYFRRRRRDEVKMHCMGAVFSTRMDEYFFDNDFPSRYPERRREQINEFNNSLNTFKKIPEFLSFLFEVAFSRFKNQSTNGKSRCRVGKKPHWFSLLKIFLEIIISSRENQGRKQLVVDLSFIGQNEALEVEDYKAVNLYLNFERKLKEDANLSKFDHFGTTFINYAHQKLHFDQPNRINKLMDMDIVNILDKYFV